MKRFDHALVIGGTGMLAGVCLQLARESYSVSVIGRTMVKIKRLQADSQTNCIFPIIADYETDNVYVQIYKAIQERGAFDLIICWAPDDRLLERICDMNQGGKPFRLVHVLGSRRYFEEETIRITSQCKYQKVFLGFVIEDSGSRWLTHEEIACGVIKQIKNDEEVGIIGQIYPYEARPT